MIITDSISNFFSKLKNGYLSKKYKITQQKSKQIIYILNIFLKEGFIKSYKISKINNIIHIYLKYKINKPVLKEIKRISKPGRRIYVKNKELFKKKKGFYLLTTSKGVVVDLQAKKYNIGGELICKIF